MESRIAKPRKLVKLINFNSLIVIYTSITWRVAIPLSAARAGRPTIAIQIKPSCFSNFHTLFAQ